MCDAHLAKRGVLHCDEKDPLCGVARIDRNWSHVGVLAAVINIAHPKEIFSGTSRCCRGPCIDVPATMLQAPCLTIIPGLIAVLIVQLAVIL